GFIEIEAAGPVPEELIEFVDSLAACCRAKHGRIANNSQREMDEPHAQDRATRSDDLAYIAFTSGSTGQPKGVMGRHAPLTLFTSWAMEKFGLNERDRFCMLSGLAHDPLHRDVFTPLQLGGAICIPEPKDLEAPER